MTKVGIYSLWRVHDVIFGAHAGALANTGQSWLWPLAWLTLVVGIVATLSSHSLRLLTANLVLISVGSLLLMVALNTEQSALAGMYYLVHSTLASALMFLVAGLIVLQRGKAEDRFVPARKVTQPALLGGLFFLAALALIGMPPLSGFIGKALMLQAASGATAAASIWPPLLLSSLAALVILTRAGSTLFWRARGSGHATIEVHASQRSAVFLLVGALVLLVTFAGGLTGYLQLAAQDMYRGISLDQHFPPRGNGGPDV
jgi:multicomponent K+:H+ antiporter subunit D